jgi:ribonuclease HIII
MNQFKEYLDSFKVKLAQAGMMVTGEKELEYGQQLVVTNTIDKVTVSLYHGKKGNSVVVGGSPGSELKKQLQALADGRSYLTDQLGEDEAVSSLPPGFEHVAHFDYCWIGTDESGKGDFFGPLVVAAVRVDQILAKELQQMGVKDSKALTDIKAKALAGRIREICAGYYVELELLPSRYNALYSQFRTEGKNLNHLLAWGHARVLEDLLAKAPCKFALADKFADEKFIQSRLMARGSQITLVQTTKAERNVAVAAASILARDRFLFQMGELSEKFAMELPKGASRQVVAAAQVFAAKFGKLALVEVAKTHFKTMEDI